MFIKCLIAGSLLLLGTSALADDGSQQDASQQGTITKVSLKDLQTKCTDLQANPQIKPIKVTVTCNELSYFWKAGDGKPATLTNQRSIGAMVQMKGFQVPHDYFSADADDTPITCQTFVKYEHKVQNVDVELSCDELAAITDLGEYCEPIVSQRAKDDSGLVSDNATKETISLCPGNAAKTDQH